MLNGKIFNSRITNAHITKKEKILGHVIGPLGALVLNSVLNTYLNIYYTDVLGLSALWNGLFLVAFPIASKLLCAAMSLFFGWLIERTKSLQGKARPYLLISAPLLTLTAILLFAVPSASSSVQVVWIIISYNLYYSMAHSMYQVAQTLMVPLSTRNSAERGSLSVVASIGVNIVSGTLSALVFTLFVYPLLQKDTSLWLPVMSILAIMALPLCVMQFYYTKERVTERQGKTQDVSFKKKLRATFGNRYWLLLLIAYFVFQIVTSTKTMSLLYFSNWVIGTYETGSRMMTIINMIGGLPVGLGALFVWPLCKRLGKRNAVVYGLLLSAVGLTICYINPYSLPLVLAGQIVKSIGSIPMAYIFSSLLGDTLDYCEWKSGIRCDGMSGSIFVFAVTVSGGLGVGLFNLILSATGYVAPQADVSTQLTQPLAVQQGLTFCYLGLDIIGTAIAALCLLFVNPEKYTDEIKSQAQTGANEREEET